MPKQSDNPELTREDVIERLAACGCADVTPYAASLQRSIWLEADKARPPELMGSRFGGPAMMPDDFEWPTYTAEPYLGRDPKEDLKTFTLWYAKQHKLPMFLIAQLNLAELPIDTPLPREGLLSFFTDPFDGVWGDSQSDRAGLRVIYMPPDSFPTLTPYEMPDRAGHVGAFAKSEWPELRINYALRWSVPPSTFRSLLEEESDSDVADRVSEEMLAISGYSFGLFLLDAGMNHQNDPRRTALEMWDPEEPPSDATAEQYYAFRAKRDQRAADEWTCVLSITKTGEIRPVVSDTGGLSFLLRKSDLASLRFDRAWLVRS